MKQKIIICLTFLLILASGAAAQQFNSVPLGNRAYEIVELGVLRGIITPPPSAKPWSEFTIKEKLNEILNDSDGRLSQNELNIVSNALASFERKRGLDLKSGRYRIENAIAGHRLTMESSLKWESNFFVRAPEAATGTANMGNINIAGDIGRNLSWNFIVGGGFFYVPRERLGVHNDPPYIDPKYGDYDGKNPNEDGHYYYYDIPPPSWSPVYSIPAWFPYTFSKPWEAAVFPPAELGDYIAWPDGFAFGYELISELSTSFFENLLQMRFGRMRRDWGPEANGSSLFMNAYARPFMAFEGTVVPHPWLRFSFLTGVLEYMKENNQWADADPYQNLFTLTYLEFDTGRHFHFDFGSATIWPKRSELGYFFPVNSNFMYQNNVGDFDNLALYADLEFRFPGKGKIWGSIYIDEIRPDAGLSSFFKLDRNMYAYQGGIKANVDWLPFGVVTVRYTKVEPFCYTHEYTETPWNRVPSDTSYLNNGESLGINLPPNSDELLLRLESIILPEIKAHIQYQMIRHGADYGPRAVDGSSLRDKIIKGDNTNKYFLRDGAYQWDHILKFGGSYDLKNRGIPLAFFSEAGIVITRFTDSNSELGEQGTFDAIDNAIYQAGTGFIFSIGFRLYP